MLGTILHHRFRLEQVLHRAPSGPLYLATDVQSGERYAVKCFPAADGWEREDGLRYRRAMERLRRLRHPGVLRPLLTACSDGVAFQVLPYAPMPALADVLVASPPTAAEAVAIVQQAAEALAALHALGLGHHNLRPSNVLVARTDDGPRVLLTDPGRPLLHDALEHALQETALSRGPHGPCVPTDSEEDAGAYLAPEQAPWLDAEVDHRADLYALGVLAYRLLAGTLPFAAGTVRERLHLHNTAAPPPLPPGAPDGAPLRQRLAPIVARLLAKHPWERYASARLLAEDWARTVASATPAAAPEAPRPADTADAPPELLPLLHGHRLHGRTDALEPLATALAQATAGAGRLLCVAGPDGSGHGALRAELLHRTEAVRGLFLSAAVPTAPWCAPFQPVADLLQALLAQWNALPARQRGDVLHRLHQRVGDHGALLTALVPSLRMLLPEPGGPAPLPVGQERLRMLHVLTEALLALGGPDAPLVLWLDGAQDCDADTVDWLRHLAHRLPHAAVLVVLATQEPAAADAPGDQRPSPVPAGLPAQRIVLAPLVEAQVAAHLADVLRMEDAQGAPTPDARRLAQWMNARWGGLPFAQRLGLRLLIARGTLRHEAGAWRCDWRALERTAWPESIPALVSHWLEVLPAEQRVVLDALAASPGGCTFDELALLLEHFPRTTLLERVEGAIGTGVLRRCGTRLRFRNRLLEQAVRTTTEPTLAAQYHGILAAHGETEPTAAPLTADHRTALHFQAAGEPQRGLGPALRLLEAARERQALRAVCHWAAWAEPHLSAEQERAALQVSAGIAHTLLGRHKQGLALLEAARATGLGELAELEVAAYAAWGAWRRGQPEQALAWVEHGLAIAGERLPANPVGTALARIGSGALRRYESLRHAADGATEQPLALREQRLAELLGLASRLLAVASPQRAALADERVLGLATGHGPSPQLVGALVRLAEADRDPAGTWLRRVRTLLDRHDFAYGWAAYHAALGRCRLGAEDWSGGREALETAADAFGRIGALVDEAIVRVTLTDLSLHQRPCLAAARDVAALAGLAEATGDPLLRTAARVRNIYCRSLTGKVAPQEAGRALRECAAQLLAAGASAEAREALALAGELALLGDDLGGLLETLHSAGASSAAEDAEGAHPLDAVEVEAHLVRAGAPGREAAYHRDEAHAALRALRAARGRDGRLPAPLRRLEVMELLLAGEPEAALAHAEEAAAELREVGLWLPLAWLQRRVAEGLRTHDDPRWMHWGGQALTALDTHGAVPYLGALRVFLQIDAPPAEDPADAAGALPPTATGGGLLAWWEALARGQPLAPDALQRALLDACLTLAGGEHAALFRPNADGQLLLAAQVPDGETTPAQSNRWLAESVQHSGRVEALANYRPPTMEAGGVPAEECSLLALPWDAAIGAQAERAVLVLGAAMSVHVYDEEQAGRLSPLLREAAALQAVAERLRVAQPPPVAAESAAVPPATATGTPPIPPDGAAQDLVPPRHGHPAEGDAAALPVLAGVVPGFAEALAAPDDRGAWLEPYLAQVAEGLALHEGRLTRMLENGWLAHYPGTRGPAATLPAADGALWGVQTLQHLLTALRNEAVADGRRLPPTGLGLHLGRVSWRSVGNGAGALPLMLGPCPGTAARLAAMSLRMRCGIVLSVDAIAALEHPAQFDLRHLGHLRMGQAAPGDRQGAVPLSVFELFSVREPREVEAMRELQDVWAEGVEAFQQGRWREAAGAFSRYARRLPRDRAARHFLGRSRRHGHVRNTAGGPGGR